MSEVITINVADANFSMLSKNYGRLDSNGRTIAWVKNGSVFFPNDDAVLCESVWREWLNAQQVKPELTERQLSDKVVAYMVSMGFSCKREVKTKLGRIDILAKSLSEKRIIECKLKCDVNSMSSALGQLLFYKHTYSDAALFVATTKKPSNDIEALLKRFNVTCLVVGE